MDVSFTLVASPALENKGRTSSLPPALVPLLKSQSSQLRILDWCETQLGFSRPSDFSPVVGVVLEELRPTFIVVGVFGKLLLKTASHESRATHWHLIVIVWLFFHL